MGGHIDLHRHAFFYGKVSFGDSWEEEHHAGSTA
jgi:hypothetical protein